MKKIASIFPGQGSQYLGMGRDFYDHFAVVRETFEEAEDVLGKSLVDLIFHGTEEELTLTKNSQIAIFVTSFAIYKAICQQFPDFQPHVCAGLSLGEYTALAAAQKISFAQCLELVGVRGSLMHQASINNPGTMAAVLGLDPSDVDAVIKQQGLSASVCIANLNCPKQVVISGTKSGIDSLSQPLKEKGAKRVLLLDVSGAFHSHLMQEAQNGLLPYIQNVSLKMTNIPIVMNVPGDYVEPLDLMKQHLISQVVSPVRWEDGIRKIAGQGVDYFLEIGCGKTLSGINKKIGLLIPTCTVEVVSDLENMNKMLSMV